MSFAIVMDEEFLIRIVKRISARYTPQLAMSGTEFIIPKYNDCILSCDSDRLTEFLQNLIENAIKYGNGKRIEPSFDKMDGCKLITVSNTDCTLETKELPQIFERFHRVHPKSSLQEVRKNNLSFKQRQTASTKHNTFDEFDFIIYALNKSITEIT